MDDFVCIRHKEFKYVFIPAEPSDPVDERTFEGTEGEFQTLIAVGRDLLVLLRF